MKVFLSADLEGTCGIADLIETERTSRDYLPFQQQMTREVSAACQGALQGGAGTLFVRDGHDSARNIDPSALPQQVHLMRGWAGDPLSMMSGIDSDSFSAAVFTGYHAWASGGYSPLGQNSTAGVDTVTLNGLPVNQFLLNAYTAAYYGVPVIFLSGDRALCDFAETLIPHITTVAVNEDRGGAVVSVHPDRAVQAIQAGVQESMKHIRECRMDLPSYFDMTVRYRSKSQAYSKSFYPGAVLEDDQSNSFSSDDWFEMLRFCHFVLG